MGLPVDITGGKIAQFTNSSALGGGEGTRNWANDKLSSLAGDQLTDTLSPKASEVFEKRSATNIFVSHEDIALQSIRGGNTTEFSENENLYGFSLFQFKEGVFGGGWSAAKANSLLASSVDANILGNTELLGVSSYFFNLHPKSMSLSEPFATAIVPTQGGGYYSESQGVVLRTLSLSGTTGYRPSLTNTPGTNQDGTIPHTDGEPTGFLNLLKLRNLFRNYSDLKKDRSKSHTLYMVWFNNKEQEAWFFEPTSFNTNRDAASPFTYQYTITGTLTQKVNFSTIVNTLSPDPESPHAMIAGVRRSAALINGFVSNYLPDFGDDVVGDIQNAGNNFLQSLSDLETTVTQLGTNINAVTMSPLLITSTLNQYGNALKTAFNSGIKNIGNIWGSIGETGVSKYGSFIKDNLCKASHEVDKVTAIANKLVQPTTLTKISKNRINGAKPVLPALLVRNPNSSESMSGKSMAPVIIPESGMSLDTFLLDLFSDPGVVDETIALNGLSYPYVTETPSYAAPFKKFLTAGDIIYVPVPSELVTGDIFTKININKIKKNLYEEILGRDLKLFKSTEATTGVSEFNLGISPTGDLDVVAGKENMVQAIDIKLNTERGELSIHPGFGIVPIMGEKGSRTLNFNLYLSLNDTMLSDGRIKELENTKVSISGDTVKVFTKAKVVGQINHIPLFLTMAK